MRKVPFNIPNIHESFKRDYLSGAMTLDQVAQLYREHGHCTYTMTLQKAADLMGVPLPAQAKNYHQNKPVFAKTPE